MARPGRRVSLRGDSYRSPGRPGLVGASTVGSIFDRRGHGSPVGLNPSSELAAKRRPGTTWTPFQRQLMNSTRSSSLFSIGGRRHPPPGSATRGSRRLDIDRMAGTPAGSSAASKAYADVLTGDAPGLERAERPRIQFRHRDRFPVCSAGRRRSRCEPGRLRVVLQPHVAVHRGDGLYVIIFVLACLSWLRLSGPLARSAFWILLLALTIIR